MLLYVCAFCSFSVAVEYSAVVPAMTVEFGGVVRRRTLFVTRLEFGLC